MAKKKSPGTLAENRKARHDYNIEDTIEAGIVLQGTEINQFAEVVLTLKIVMRKLKTVKCI
ncbi:tmRNA-binding protein SmpB [Staphylococcus aureus]|uniref:TmRNA-binding protein SmpB n=1 Tax=Staphylococcus aureus TaxID=1280 RepID=A0A2X2KJ73_STAAU|nr:tmRNA-binding protein SmpB [Staphylococcus aureus]